MKIGVVTSTYPRHEGDYAVPWMREAVAKLRDRGCSMSVFAPSYMGLKDHEIDGVPVRRFRYFPKRWERLTHEEGAPNKLGNPLFQMLTIPYVLAGARAAAKWAMDERLDLVHVHWPFPHGVFGEAVRRSTGVPVVSTCHGAELAIARRKPWVRPILSRYLRIADSLTANSSDTARHMKDLCGREARVIPFGTTVRASQSQTRPDSKPVILFTGRLIQRKGVEYLIDALPEILASRDVSVVITGDGDRRESIERRIRHHGLEGVVEMRGFVDNETLQQLYASSHVYVLPAIHDDRGDTEGLGVTSIEAFLHGLPVVASGVGGIVDVVKDRETGLLVPEKDPGAIARAVLELLGDHQFGAQLAAEGLKHAQEFFSWERITDEMTQVYEGALRVEQGEAAAIGGMPIRE